MSETMKVNLDRPATEVEAQLAEEQFERECVERGEALLARLSSQDPTHSDLKKLVEQEQASITRLGQHKS